MENIINTSTFIQHLTYYIKIGIYINKGTDQDCILDKCIKLYNKYKTIEISDEISDENEVFVRKCLKRLNLVLKIDENGKPVNIREKENQLKMIYLEGHPSLADNNLNDMISYATEHGINILTDIPMVFILKENKYQELSWQYTRSLFYISQLLISKIDTESDMSDIVNVIKKKIYDDAIEKLEIILETISGLETEIKMNQIMAVDKFLNIKLIKSGFNEKNVNDARQEVKDLFMKKGLETDNSMIRMIDSISDKLLSSIDLSEGNILQNMFKISQNVAQEMKTDIENNPEKFRDTIGVITEVFKEAIDDPSQNSKQIPAELKNMFNTILSTKISGNDDESNEEAVMANLEQIIQTNNLDRDEFFTAIQDTNGKIDVNRLENLLTNIK